MTSGVHEIATRQISATAASPDLSIKTLGSARITSPLATQLDSRQTTQHYVDEGDRVLLDDTLSMVYGRNRRPAMPRWPAPTPT